MDRREFREQLQVLDLSDREDEREARSKMVALLDECSGCFARSTFPAHFTGSALVLSADGTRALLHHHRKLDRWLQFGGHCDGNEDVLRVACREAREESGIENLVVASARPFDLDLHELPAHADEPSHWHYDVRYVLIAPADAVCARSAESKELRWFTVDEMEQLSLDGGLQRMVAKWRALCARRAHQSVAEP